MYKVLGETLKRVTINYLIVDYLTFCERGVLLEGHGVILKKNPKKEKQSTSLKRIRQYAVYSKLKKNLDAVVES